ncbi:hypothetical protein SBI_02037 [Streptomyces bingchenggensis BCW-1]|uniref:Uncharacterized protein n=1 Tax=Streptomyces bingchenggensis (strain BCW-1) TaxID=749414 RepID=D7BRJ5_STRBB|nr:hypothetical protein SBI_02037 [Streptomyces bingchenggensis BCW-1]
MPPSLPAGAVLTGRGKKFTFIESIAKDLVA